jgi:hypothetical protein
MSDALMVRCDEPGFAVVYQGGHHDVYCNGQEHRTAPGGFTGSGINAAKVCPASRVYRCNCGEYASGQERS